MTWLEIALLVLAVIVAAALYFAYVVYTLLKVLLGGGK